MATAAAAGKTGESQKGDSGIIRGKSNGATRHLTDADDGNEHGGHTELDSGGIGLSTEEEDVGSRVTRKETIEA